MQHKNNIAYIDWQNLHLWTRSEWRSVHFEKFRKFLSDKFHVQEAHYFLWFVDENEQDLYTSLQKAWFIVTFREHSSTLKWKKKWNVDVDIVYEVMKRLYEDDDFDKIVLVSGDGDYIKLVKHLHKKWKLERIIFPNKNHSSLYNKLSNKCRYYLTNAKKKISYNKKGVS